MPSSAVLFASLVRKWLENKVLIGLQTIHRYKPLDEKARNELSSFGTLLHAIILYQSLRVELD